MIHIEGGYKHYEDLVEKVGINRIDERYQFLYESVSKFIDRFALDDDNIKGQIRINERLLTHAILEYFEDIDKVKTAHDLEHTNSPKVMAYMSYWFLRRHPIQLLSNIENDDFVFINEKFILSMLMSYLTSGNEAKPLSDIDRDIYIAFVNSFYYFLKFRRLDPQTIEMILLSFRLGGVFPECKNIQ